MTLVPLPTKGAKSLLWSESLNKLLTEKALKFEFSAQWSDLALFVGNGTKVKIPSEIKPLLVSSILAKDKVQYVRFPIGIWTKPICVFWQRPVEQHRRGLSRKIICWMFRKKLYFVSKIVLTYCEKKICSSDREKPFERPRIFKNFEITMTFY